MNYDCEQCGRCCRYLIFDFGGETTFADPLWELRNIIFKPAPDGDGGQVIIPCACLHVYPTMDGRWLCSIHDTEFYPFWCRDQPPWRTECLTLHEVIPNG